MHRVKVLAVMGLVLVMGWFNAQAQGHFIVIEISGKATAGILFIQVDDRPPVQVTLTEGQDIPSVIRAIVNALNTQKQGSAQEGKDSQTRIWIRANAIKIGETAQSLQPLPLQVNQAVTARGLTFKFVGIIIIDGFPTLTEWGVIALGVLLAGSLAWMIRRRMQPKLVGV